MITKEKKREIVAQLAEKFEKANSYYFVDFAGMKVSTTIGIRREFKKQNIEVKVAKNTLIKRALDSIGIDVVPEKEFSGPTCIIFAYDDPVSPAKIIKESVDKNIIPKFKYAVLEKQYYDGSQLNTLATLPSKSEIIASILGSINAPISGIVGSINAVMRDVAYLVEEVAKKKAEN